MFVTCSPLPAASCSWSHHLHQRSIVTVHASSSKAVSQCILVLILHPRHMRGFLLLSASCSLPRHARSLNLQDAADHLDCAPARRQYTCVGLPICVKGLLFCLFMFIIISGLLELLKEAPSSSDGHANTGLPATARCRLAVRRHEFSPKSLQSSPRTTGRKLPLHIPLMCTAENAIVHHIDGFLPHACIFVPVKVCKKQDRHAKKEREIEGMRTANNHCRLPWQRQEETRL